MKILITLTIYFSTNTLWGLTAFNPESQVFSSPKNTYLLRFQNDVKKENQKFYVYKFNLEKKEYESLSHFAHPYLIGKVFINDLGTHIININEYEQFINIYNIQGQELKVLNFHDFYTIEERKEHGYEMSTIRHIDNVQWGKNSFIINPIRSTRSEKLKLERLTINLTSFNTKREHIDYSKIKEKGNSSLFLFLLTFYSYKPFCIIHNYTKNTEQKDTFRLN